MTYHVDQRTDSYYDRTDRATAVQIVSEMVEEWDYESDAHGYCHVRPALVRLLEIAAEAGYDARLLYGGGPSR